MKNISRLKKTFKKFIATHKTVETPAFLGNLAGTVQADVNQNVYVVLQNGEVLTVRNTRAPNVPRLPVIIGYDADNPTLLQVLRARDVFLNPPYPDIPQHADATHQWPTHDTLWVRGEQFLPGLAIPTSGFVVQFMGFVFYMSGWHSLDNQEIDFTTVIPAVDGAKYILVEIDSAGVISFNSGAIVASRELLTYEDIPTPTANKFPLFAVKVYYGQASILKTRLLSDIVDLRWSGFSAGSGGGVPYTGATANVDLGAYDLSAEAIIVGNHAAVFGAAGDVEMFAPDGANPAVIQHAHGGMPGVVSFTSGGTEASPTAVVLDQVLHNVAVYAYDGVSDYVNAHLKALAAENHSATNQGTKWALYATPNGSTVEELIATFDADGMDIPTGNTYKINGASLDTLFAAIANGVTNGNSHDHSGGDGAQIAHTALSSIGTNTHAQIDTHIANVSNPHSVTAAQASAIPNNGWIAISATGTSGTLDSPSFEISFNADMTALIGLGYRIKITQSTTKYFIVTKVGAYSGGATIITCYGGTDYTLVSSGTTAITDPFYSPAKLPFGFPADPTKWTVTLSNTTQYAKTAPTNGTWYGNTTFNAGVGPQITAPIGAWFPSYKALIASFDTTVTDYNVWSSLSTSSSTESHSDMTTLVVLTTPSGTYKIWNTVTVNGALPLLFTAKTVLYLILKTTTSTADTIYIRGEVLPTIIRLVCAYL